MPGCISESLGSKFDVLGNYLNVRGRSEPTYIGQIHVDRRRQKEKQVRVVDKIILSFRCLEDILETGSEFMFQWLLISRK
jgi:hypothetical protein